MKINKCAMHIIVFFESKVIKEQKYKNDGWVGGQVDGWVGGLFYGWQPTIKIFI